MRGPQRFSTLTTHELAEMGAYHQCKQRSLREPNTPFYVYADVGREKSLFFVRSSAELSSLSGMPEQAHLIAEYVNGVRSNAAPMGKTKGGTAIEDELLAKSLSALSRSIPRRRQF